MTESPWFGYGPEEKPSTRSDVVFPVVPDHNLPVVTDEMWMDVIAEGKFRRSVDRHDHGTRVGGEARCQCLLCRKWRRVERNSVKVRRILPIEDPNHPINRIGPKMR